MTNKNPIRKPRESIVIHGGQSRQVVVRACPECGTSLKGVSCPSISLRFKCPHCHVSIANTNQNRCDVCLVMCSDTEAYNAHVRDGCENAGTLFKGSLMRRGEV